MFTYTTCDLKATPKHILQVWLCRSSLLILVLSLFSFQSVQSLTTTTIPPTTVVPGCASDGKFYRPGEEITRGKVGDWCFGSSCSPSGEIVRWDNFNCGTATTPLTTTPKQNGCLDSGTLYKPGQTISRGQSGNWCYGSYCDLNSEVIKWDNFNCDPSTVSPSTTRTTTTAPTTAPPTAVPPTPQPGCFYNGNYYPPGRSIQSEGVGCGVFCTIDGEILYASCTHASTTTPIPTPKPGCTYQGKYYPPEQLIDSDGCGGVFCGKDGEIRYASCFRPPTTTPTPPTKITTTPIPSIRETISPIPPTPETITPTPPTRRTTTTITPIPGCYYNGNYYPSGQTIESDGNGCGVFCNADGELLYATCTRLPTTMPIPTTPLSPPPTPPSRTPTTTSIPTIRPPTTTRPGCEHQGNFYSVGARFGEGKSGSWCYGMICGEGGEVLAWDNWNCDPTTFSPTPTPPSTTATTPPPACFYNGNYYPPGQTIESDGQGCGIFCSTDGELLYATCSRAPTTMPIPTTTYPTTKRPGCFFNGNYYPLGQKIESNRNGCGAFCGADGEIMYATCTKTPTATSIPTILTPIPTGPGCKHQGKFYPVGARFGEGKSGSWCYGMICSEVGEILTWDNFNCDMTTPLPTTSDATKTSARSTSCNYDGKIYLPGEEISRVKGTNMCYGTLCDDNGDVIAWEDYTCGNSTDDAQTTQGPVKDCQYKGISYKPGQKIALSDGRGCKVYCSLLGRVRIERFPCVQPVTQPQSRNDVPREDWPPCIQEQHAGPETPRSRICSNGAGEKTINSISNLITLSVIAISFSGLV